MLLESKTAVVFAATGAVGSAVARRFAGEGACVFLSGRDEGALTVLGRELDASWEVVDACDDAEVGRHVERIAARAGGIDVLFNAIGPRPADADYMRPSTALSLESFLLPMRMIAGSQFTTARAAARTMARTMAPRGRGAIVLLSASLTGLFVPAMAGITAACGAVEARPVRGDVRVGHQDRRLLVRGAGRALQRAP